LSLIDNALDIVPGDPFALYLKGRVLWCGREANEDASSIFEEVLASPDLGSEVRNEVAADLAAASSGERCS
jgi:hypothetical protein